MFCYFEGVSALICIRASEVNISSQNYITYPEENIHYAIENQPINISCSYIVEEENIPYAVELFCGSNQNDSRLLVSVSNSSLSYINNETESGSALNTSIELGLIMLYIENFNSDDYSLTYWCRKESIASFEDSLTLIPITGK